MLMVDSTNVTHLLYYLFEVLLFIWSFIDGILIVRKMDDPLYINLFSQMLYLFFQI